MYSEYIIHQSHTSNFSPQNQRDIVLDIAENLTQIGNWTLQGFTQEKGRIELYLRLTRKDVNALLGFPLKPGFDPDFKKICRSFNRLEKEYHTGISDHRIWANWMISLGNTITQSAKLV